MASAARWMYMSSTHASSSSALVLPEIPSTACRQSCLAIVSTAGREEKPSELKISTPSCGVERRYDDVKSSASRRSIVLAGVAAFVGAGGANLLLTPRTEASDSKQVKLPLEDIKNIIEADVTERQYYVTGNMTGSIYDDNCRFQDPIQEMSGLQKYIEGIQLLFDPASSKHELLDIGVSGPHTVEVSWRLSGYLKFPWHPYISPYEGITVYTTDDKSGLIVSHKETWNLSLFTAFVQFLTPSWLNKDAPK